MKQHRDPQRVLIGMILFSWVLVIGILTFTRPPVVYELPVDQSLELGLSYDAEVFPEDLQYMVEDGEEGFQLIDIRNPYEYDAGHIDGAINIPAYAVFEKDNLRLLRGLQKDSIRVIIYGKKQADANGVWMLLQQTGISISQILLGGYEYYSTMDPYAMEDIPAYLVEEPEFDFAAIQEEIMYGGFEVMESQGTQPEPVVPRRKKKSSAAEGGC